MISGLFLITILILLVFIVAITWRIASRGYTIPCPVWMKGMLDSPFARGVSPRTQRTIQHLDLRPGMRVLDAGCGPGRLTLPMAEIVGAGGEITAIDIQEGMLHEAQERATAAGLSNIRFLRYALGAGGLEPGSYDRGALVTVLGEIPDREAALSDIYGALKPGGLLLVEETIRDPHFQSRNTVLRLANAAGFREKEFSGNFFSFALVLEKPA